MESEGGRVQRFNYGMECKTRNHVHILGLSLLYAGPKYLIISPKMTKLAARRGVGAMIVRVILTKPVNKYPRKDIGSYILHLERR